MNISTDVLIQIALAMASGVGAYAAIRSDLARLHERTAQALQGMERAHERIDAVLERKQ